MAKISDDAKKVIKELRDHPLSEKEQDKVNAITKGITDEFCLSSPSDFVKLNIYAKQLLMSAKLESAMAEEGIVKEKVSRKYGTQYDVSKLFYAWQNITANTLNLIKNLEETKRKRENSKNYSTKKSDYNVLLDID